MMPPVSPVTCENVNGIYNSRNRSSRFGISVFNDMDERAYCWRNEERREADGSLTRHEENTLGAEKQQQQRRHIGAADASPLFADLMTQTINSNRRH